MVKPEAVLLLLIGILGVLESSGKIASRSKGLSVGHSYTLGLSLILLILTAVWLWLEAAARRSRGAVAGEEQATSIESRANYTDSMIMFGIMAAYSWLCPQIGYVPATGALYVGLLKRTGYKWVHAIAYACLIAVVFWWVFSTLAKVSLP